MTADEAVVAVLEASKPRAVRGPELDWVYLRGWSTTHGTSAMLEQIRGSIPLVKLE